MDLRTARDSLLREAHESLLRSTGFALRSSKSESHEPPLHRALALTSQPWNTSSRIDFDLVVVVAHDDYNPNQLHGVKPGLSAKDDHLLWRGLAEATTKNTRFWSITNEHDLEIVRFQVVQAIGEVAVPLLQQASTLESVAKSQSLHRTPYNGFKPRSWLLKKMGDQEGARKVVLAAIADAPNERAKEMAGAWLSHIDT